MSSSTSLIFDLFGRDVSASKAIKDVAKEAEHSSGSMAASFKKAATGVTLAGLAAVGESIHMAADFQQQMTRLVSAAGESESNLKMVSDGVLKIARDTGISTGELAKGMYQVESAGFHGAHGLEVMTAAAQGAQVEGANVESVANALTTVMDDLHAPASKAADIMSQMVAAVGQGKMTMDDLAGSIHSVLPNAASLGMSFAEVAGDLAEMTSQGMSADQSAQNLNHTIVKLASPTQGMTKAMSMYGLTASDVAKRLGKKGLSGTLDELSLAILHHMGPAGTTLLNTFNTSKVAGQDLQIMLKSMPKDLQTLSQSFLDGKTSAKDFSLKLKGDFGGTDYALGKQFLGLVTSQRGFNEALKSGTPAAQTFQAAMKGMLGDQTGLQVALHLTGKAADDTTAKINIIGKAHADAAGNVAEFAMKEKNLNIEAAKMKEVVATAAITFGTKLIPVVSTSVGWLTKHADIVEKGVIGLVALAVAVKTVEFAIRVGSAAMAVWNGLVKLATMLCDGLQAVFGTTAAEAQAAALVQAEAAATIATSEADKAAATAEAAVNIAASLEGTQSVLAAEATAAADAAIEFAAAMQAQADAAVAAAAEIEAAMAAAATAEEEAGAAATTAFGPIGIAIGAVVGVGALAAHALGLFGSSAKKQIKPTDDFTNAIRDDNDALGENTRKLVENKLEKDGAYDAGLKLGISQKTLTDALMGNSAAMQTVNDKILAGSSAGLKYLASNKPIPKSILDMSNAAGTLNGVMGDLTTTLAVNKKAAENIAAADSKTAASAKGAATAFQGSAAAAEHVGSSAKAATPYLGNLGTALSKLSKTHAYPTVSVNDQASSVLERIRERVSSLNGAQIVAKVDEISTVHKATGGLVSGAGTGTSDSISARLSNGEFVVRASQVGKNLRLLQAINAGHSMAGALTISAASPASSYGSRGGTTINVEQLSVTAPLGNGDQVMREVLRGLQRLKGSGIQVNLG